MYCSIYSSCYRCVVVFTNFILPAVIFAHQLQTAVVTLRGTCLAYIPSVQDEPVVSNGNLCFRNVFNQFLLYAERSGAFVGYQSQTVADAENVGIYRHGGFIEDDRLDYICRFASHTGKFHELFQCVGHLAVEVFHQHLSHAYEMLGLVVRVGYTAYVFVYYFRSSGCKRFGSGEVPVKGGSYHIYPLVCALGGKNYRNQQFVRVVIM